MLSDTYHLTNLSTEVANMDVAKTKELKENQPSEKENKPDISQTSHVLPTFDEMDRMFDHWFDNTFQQGWLRPFNREWPSLTKLSNSIDTRIPKIDIIDRDEEIIVRAELPGIDKDNLDVSVSDNSITIKAETKQVEKVEKGEYFRSEISRGSYARTIKLPHNIDTENPKAKFKDGVLELNLPKIEKTNRRNIKIE